MNGCCHAEQDRSFTFILKTPPASFLIRTAAGVPKGSGTPNSQKVGAITRAQLKVQPANSPACSGSIHLGTRVCNVVICRFSPICMASCVAVGLDRHV